MSNPLNIEIVRKELHTLLTDYPELKDDEELLDLSIKSETSAFEFLQHFLNDMLHNKSMQAGIKSRMEELKKRKSRLDQREEMLRKLMLRLMEVVGWRKAELPEATLSIRATPAAVRILDEVIIPDEFYRIKKELNLLAIREALKSGQSVPGAALSNSPDTLAIRTE